MDPIKIEQKEIKEAIRSGNQYIQVGNRKFLLFEVEEVNDNNYYIVTDPEEEQQLLEALNENNQILDDEEIKNLLEN